MNRSMSNQVDRYRRDILFAAFAVAILAAGGFGVHCIAESDANIAQLHRQANRLATQADSLERASLASRARFNAEKQTIADAKAQLQSPDAINTTVSTILDLATSQSLRVDNVEPGEMTTGQLWKMPVMLGGQGNYAAVVQFLDSLHGKLPSVAVESIDLRAANERLAAFQVKLVVHVLPVGTSGVTERVATLAVVN